MLTTLLCQMLALLVVGRCLSPLVALPVQRRVCRGAKVVVAGRALVARPRGSWFGPLVAV